MIRLGCVLVTALAGLSLVVRGQLADSSRGSQHFVGTITLNRPGAWFNLAYTVVLDGQGNVSFRYTSALTGSGQWIAPYGGHIKRATVRPEAVDSLVKRLRADGFFGITHDLRTNVNDVDGETITVVENGKLHRVSHDDGCLNTPDCQVMHRAGLAIDHLVNVDQWLFKAPPFHEMPLDSTASP